VIAGARVRLRAIERQDLPRYVAWFNDPEVRRGLAQIFPLSQSLEDQWFEHTLTLEPHERPFSVDVRRGRGWVHIGSCGLFRFEPYSRNAELGIMIGEKRFWDRGYGTQAVRLLLGHAFDTLNLHRVFLRVFASNPRAIRAYEKVGFILEGRLREDRFADGGYEDTLLMSVLEHEWRAGAGGKG
jgi:RimJ/RimL family protein N-acetyltransferase